jgi:hypothetical protein
LVIVFTEIPMLGALTVAGLALVTAPELALAAVAGLALPVEPPLHPTRTVLSAAVASTATVRPKRGMGTPSRLSNNRLRPSSTAGIARVQGDCVIARNADRSNDLHELAWRVFTRFNGAPTLLSGNRCLLGAANDSGIARVNHHILE